MYFTHKKIVIRRCLRVPSFFLIKQIYSLLWGNYNLFVNKINCKKATNEKVHPLLAVATLFVIFSVGGSIINAHAQQFSGNRSSIRVDLAVESLENGQLLSTPRPSANDLGAPAEQTDNNQEEVANIEPELDEQEPASQDSTEVNEMIFPAI